MNLTCDILERIQGDFNALWRCQQRGNTIEISVPYLLPDSTLVSLLLTQRGERTIVCEGGGILEILSEYCPLPKLEALTALRDMAGKFGIAEGKLGDDPIFFKECTDPKLISSLVFDVANFVMTAASALVAVSAEDDPIPAARFESEVKAFVKTIKPANVLSVGSQIPEVPGFRFSSVLRGSESATWLISSVSGSNWSQFRKNVNDTAASFKHAWESRLGSRIVHTIPILNDAADGYNSDKLTWALEGLRHEAHGILLTWSEKNKLDGLLKR